MVKKLVIKTVLIAVLVFFISWYLPWWNIMLAAFLINVLYISNGVSSFFSSFLGVGIVWFFKAYAITVYTGDILTWKMAEILGLNGHSFLLILLTGVLGGLAAGIAGLTGYSFIKLFRYKQKRSLRYKKSNYSYFREHNEY